MGIRTPRERGEIWRSVGWASSPRLTGFLREFPRLPSVLLLTSGPAPLLPLWGLGSFSPASVLDPAPGLRTWRGPQAVWGEHLAVGSRDAAGAGPQILCSSRK